MTKKNIFTKHKKKIIIVLLSLILLVGFYIRAAGVFSNSFAFTYDVGRDMLKVQEMIEQRKIPLIGQTTGLGGLFYGPWWYYILAPAFIISNGNPQGVAFFMVFCGLFAVVLGFFVGRKISGTVLGIVFASLLCVSPVMIGFSNQIWNPNIAPAFILLLLLMLVIVEKSKKRFFTLLTIGLLLGLLIDTEILFGVLFAAASLLYILVTQRKKLLSFSVLGIPLGLFVIFLPRIYFEIRHQFIMTNTLLHPAKDKEAFLNLNGLFSGVFGRGLTIFNQFSETVARNNNILGLLILISCCVLLVMFRNKLNTISRHMLLFTGIVLLTFILGTSIFARAIWGHYLVGLPVLYLLFVSLSLLVLIRKAFYLGVVVLAVYVMFLLNPYQLYKDAGSPLWEGDAAVYRNQIAVIDYIYKDANGRQFNEIVYTPAVYDFPYQYLFSWYGRVKYNYTPETKTEKLFYVVVEPDPGYEGRITDWLKIREGDGKVVKEKTVKGGISVQTRTR